MASSKKRRVSSFLALCLIAFLLIGSLFVLTVSAADTSADLDGNPFADYYTDGYQVEVTTGGYVSDPQYSRYWSVNTFNLFVTETDTDDTAAYGEGCVLIEYPELVPSGGVYANVCGRMEDMSGWPAKKVNDIVSLYSSQKSFDGTGTLPERGAAYAYVYHGDDCLEIIYDSYLPVRGAPNVYIEYSLGFEFPVETELADALGQIEPYDDAAKKTNYTLEWRGCRFLKEPEGGSTGKEKNGLPKTAGGIIAVSLLTALIGGAAGAVVSAAGGVAGAAAGAVAETAGEVVGEAAGTAAEAGFDLGPHIRMDEDGDLHVKDPATGEERLYKDNGDGTYTDPLTGATYTPAELKDSLESREENADLIRQDEAVREAAVTAQAEDNKDLSFYDAEARAERETAEKEAAHDLYKEKMYIKHGVEEGDDKGVKRDILEDANEEYRKQAEYEARAEYANAGYETAKQTKQAADVAIDVMAEIDKTGMGKVVKDGYAVASSAAGNAGEVMAGEKSVGAALAQTVVDSTAELAKNHTDSVAGKYAANIFGDSAKEMSKEALKGGSMEDIRKAGEKGAISGAVNATIDVAFDGAGELASSAMKDGEKVIGKVLGEEITKETAAGAAKTLTNDVVKNALGDDDD